MFSMEYDGERVGENARMTVEANVNIKRQGTKSKGSIIAIVTGVVIANQLTQLTCLSCLNCTARASGAHGIPSFPLPHSLSSFRFFAGHV